MPKNGLTRLPNKVAASLLIALESLPPRRNRLVLKRPETDRAPEWNRLLDYNVMFNGSIVGRVWRHVYKNHPFEGRLWHWYFHYAHGMKAEEGGGATLDEAITSFRSAWDAASASAASRAQQSGNDPA